MEDAHPVVRPAGDGALLIELGVVSPATTKRARLLAGRIRAAAWPGVYDVVPAYRTVLLRFDPCSDEAGAFPQRIERLLQEPLDGEDAAGKLVEIPVCYGGVHGPDLPDVARHTGLTPEEVIRRHAAGRYRVEFLGFSPGFPYLSGLPRALATPRLPAPRTRVPAGSVGIAGAQTGFYPLESPGGWRLIGRIPTLRFDPARPETLPYGPGDTIRFVPVDGTHGSLPSSAPRTSRAGQDHEPDVPTAGTGVAPQSSATQSLADNPEEDPPVERGLRVVRAGLLTTIQDRGRFGLAALGYGTAGALDPVALRIGNLLVGNAPDAAAIELTLDGGELEAIGDLVIALTGADLSPSIDGEPVPLWHAYAMRHGARLRFGARRSGLRAYLAVAGGIVTPPLLGSRASDLVAGLRGLAGRPVRAGDRVPVGRPAMQRGWVLDPASIPRYEGDAVARVIWGPQDHWFDEAARRLFVAEPFTVSARSDRTGLRLEGLAIAPVRQQELASEGVVPGSIQVPAGGQPIVLLADSRGVGGYPKIATVISADLYRLGQAPPGTRVRFEPVTPAEAWRAARAQRGQLETATLRPAPELSIHCLLEGGPTLPSWRCPHSLACLVSHRCLAGRYHTE